MFLECISVLLCIGAMDGFDVCRHLLSTMAFVRLRLKQLPWRCYQPLRLCRRIHKMARLCTLEGVTGDTVAVRCAELRVAFKAVHRSSWPRTWTPCMQTVRTDNQATLQCEWRCIAPLCHRTGLPTWLVTHMHRVAIACWARRWGVLPCRKPAGFGNMLSTSLPCLANLESVPGLSLV